MSGSHGLFRKRIRILFNQIFRLAFAFIWLFFALLPASLEAHAQGESGAVYVAEVKGIINPPLAGYVLRVLEDAAEDEAALVVLVLDTPGGLDTSMREINQAILASPVPVSVFVAPPGARAASAGLFILMSSHIAAMAPGTNTGAAHPVALGSGQVDETSAAKAVNDAAATIRALANERGRNAEWAEQAVRESVSVTAYEAYELGVIDLVAKDLDELLLELDGMVVEMGDGQVELSLAEAGRVTRSMNFAEQFLHQISDPNIAFLLLSVGSIALIAEIYNPGMLVPGITGLIALLLGFTALGNLPTNWAGVAFIGLSVILFIAELNTTGIGFLGIASLVSLILGGLILYRPFNVASPVLPDLRVNPWILGGSGVVTGSVLLFLVTHLVRIRRAPLLTGAESYSGREAVVRQELNPNGVVHFEGQNWRAKLASGGKVPAGKRVQILEVKGLTLIVEPLPGSKAVFEVEEQKKVES